MEDEQKSAAERLVSLADTLTISLNTFVTKNLDAISNMGSTFISFVDETLHLLKKSKDDYEERLKQELEVEKLSTSASEEEQKLNAQLARARTQLDTLKQQYSIMQEEYRKALADFEEERRVAFEALPATQKAHVKEDLEWRLRNYESMLRMKIEQRDENSIIVIFWGLNPADESQQYSFRLITREDGEIIIEDPTIEIANLDLFLSDAKITGNIPLLIRRIRLSFLQLAECEDSESVTQD
ncbi:Chromosome segregation protein Spc25 [Giardia duodenalis]|uniref:Kinetochore protein SPC25 n=1 Tax=Giardia intestinalis (strain ATCC 50803 / WB clone C6) TaxID=184922 RepID=A8BNW6_GIAIC|nr:Chromosome segregation protein Spc25 [Giardia intestinalis]KAE8304666.1 Chromosome segregation protein Spc25 [Giardia intestinalis]|eukprot:XP_001705813.1 Hypothetical protein GL50803_2833 [Giardia lamblia ATCC 50803]